MVQARNAAKARLRNRGKGRADFECVLSLLGRVPATKRNLTANEQLRVNAECTGAKAGTPPKVELRLSNRNEALTEGTTVTSEANVENDVEVVSLPFVINGEEQPPINDVAGFTGLEFPLPLGITSLEVKVKATDGDGNFVWESVDLPVAQDPPSTVVGSRLGNG